MGQSSAHNGAPKYVPSGEQKLLIIGQDLGSVGGLTNYANGYIDNTDHVPAGITTYTGIPGLNGLATKDNWGAGDVHAQLYIDDINFDNTVTSIGLYINGQLENIISGSRNSDIRKLARWVIDSDRPVFLRIGYEFDGPWNGLDPDLYKEAWIQIVKIFDEEEVRNVAYVWQSAGINTTNIERWYPGDQYVNWVGYSEFDGTNMGASILAFADEHNKPVMIAEATPRVDLADLTKDHWGNWYVPLFNKIESNTRIKALAYINADWDSQPMWTGQGWGDSRVEVNQTVYTNWNEVISGSDWLVSSTSLFEELEYAKWQDSIVLNIDSRLDLLQDIRFAFSNNELIISSASSEIIDITISDSLGREIARTKNPSREYRIRVAESGSVLIIRARTNNASRSFKVKI
jgi:hypothetical protein